MRNRFQTDLMPAVAVFAGSFLLFLVQPMLGRTLLPVFGGSAAVWGVCLAAYQVLLLAGYAYAHGLAQRPLPVQLRTHRFLLASAVVWAFAAALLRVRLKELFGVGGAPSLHVLLCVLACVGLPYVLLAAGGTLMQAWVAGARLDDAGGGPRVYRLYAVSNLGAFLGLLAYPLALEPFVPLTAQWYGFAAGLTLYAACVVRLGAAAELGAAMPRDYVTATPFRRAAPLKPEWFLLPAASAFLLNAVVAHLFVDVTPMPLVWVIVLSAFLLSYAAGFSPAGERWLGVWCGLAWAALAGSAVANGMWGTGSFYPNAVAAVALVFSVGVVLHGWLYARRPEAASLTRYYLAIAAGGAAGGLSASLIAPVVFKGATEYPLSLLLCVLLVAWRAPKPGFLARSTVRTAAFASFCGLLGLLVFAGASRHTRSRTLFRGRNFYGCLRVSQTVESFGQAGALPVNYLWCGQTTHGIQVLSPMFKGTGASYYGKTGGGIPFYAHPKRQAGEALKVGVVGLGAGSLAVYGKSGDLFRFFEINPQVVRVATDPTLFTFLPEAEMPIDLVPGDARRMLEVERAAHNPRYDILVIDAYSGDAVPYHLATEEAFRLYFDRLAPDGILAVHVSNWHIDLLPLCKAVAGRLGAVPYGVVGVVENSVTTDAMWVFMTRRPMTYRFPGKPNVREVVWENIPDMTAPTDEKGSLISLLRL